MSGEAARSQADFVKLDSSLCHDPEQAAFREWWLANGIGGYSGGTVSGVLTRRYHGLLVAPLYPPLGRLLLFVKAEPVLLDGTQEISLYSNQWRGGVLAPDNSKFIDGFRLEGSIPVWHYSVNELKVEQRIWMQHGKNQTHVAFKWTAGERLEVPRIRLGLIASLRDHHGVNQTHGFEFGRETISNGIRLHLRDGHFIEVQNSGGEISSDDTWIENFYLARENERGLEDIDNHLRVGFAELPLMRDTWAGITVGLGEIDEIDLKRALAAEQSRVARLQQDALPGVSDESKPAWVRQLVAAADSYVFRRKSPGKPGRYSVIAGYPWFGDWGRDTMIALPGLTLATGRAHIAKEILATFTGLVSEGMLPNVFPGRGETPEYNTVDAALWFIEAWCAYFRASADRESMKAAFPVLVDIVQAYRNGTRFGIAMDPGDGLMCAGVAGQQLTWMDARVDGREITPRHGKPVEINALWYNALRTMAYLAVELGEDADMFEQIAARVAVGFGRFDRGGDKGLYDVLDGPAGNDATIRPNQIFTVSLPFSPLSPNAKSRVLEECREHLLTPYGLRSLSPNEPAYSGRYTGGVKDRDGSYHQGPVWGWLLGHYAIAEYTVYGDAHSAQGRLEAMAGHLLDAGLGHISEIFDGDPPHAPRGAPAQAWSVACTLEAWWRLQVENQTHLQGG